MRITIVTSNNHILINGQGLSDIQQDLSWIPSNVHAVQWYDTYGEVEYTDGTPNEIIEELGIYEQAIDDYTNETQRLINEELLIESLRDYSKDFRIFRNERLLESDWTQLADTQLTQEKKEEWRLYRQELRDLPKNIEDLKPLVVNLSHPDWPVQPL